MAIRTRSPISPTSGRLPATPPHVIRTGSWLEREAPTDASVYMRYVAAALCVAVVVLSSVSLAELAARTLRSHSTQEPAARPRALPYPRLELPLEIAGSQYVPLAFSDIPGWGQDDHLAAFKTFRESCKPIAAQSFQAQEPR